MMEVAPHARRRKACDLCTSKRIKCDGLKPLCSNCVLYGVEECRITALVKPSPRAGARDATPIRKPARPTERNERVHDIEARLERMESLMQLMARRIQKADSNSDDAPSTVASSSRSRTTGNGSPPVRSIAVESVESDRPSGQGEPGPARVPSDHPPRPLESAYVFGQHQQLQLPALEEALPVLENYFLHFNTVIPLFHKPTFTTMLHGCYAQPSAPEWAAINIAMAISYRIVDNLHMDDPKLATCVQNAQSVLVDLMLRTQDLLGLQVLLGMVLLFQGTARVGLHRAVPSLMGSASKLAQVMRLHKRLGTSAILPAEALQRNRVFWITYMLDKDTSLRFRTPSSFFDADIDRPLPPCELEDGAGPINSLAGLVSAHFLHARIHLAYIQGKVYDLLCNPRAPINTPEEKLKRVSRCQKMLTHWYQSLPPAFRSELLHGSFSGIPVQHILTLFYTHLLCLLIMYDIHGAHNQIMAKVKLDFYESEFVLEDNAQPSARHPCFQTPLIPGWSHCVESSRACLKSATVVGQVEYFTWYNSCSYFTAGLVILANMVELPDHANILVDQQLIDHGFQLFDRLIEYSSHDNEPLRVHFYRLNMQARSAVARVAKQKAAFSLNAMDGQNQLQNVWAITPEGPDIGLDESFVPDCFSSFEPDFNLPAPGNIIADEWDISIPPFDPVG